MCSMKYLYSMTFGSQIWSSICYWNSLKLLHVLYSDFEACVKHKNKPYLTVLPFRFVFCLREAKYTFTSKGFVLDLIIPLHRGNLSFFWLHESNWSRNWSFFHNPVHNTKCFHSRGRSATAATPTMELFVAIVNGF